MPKDLRENFRRNLPDWCHDVKRAFEVFICTPLLKPGELSVSANGGGMLWSKRVGEDVQELRMYRLYCLVILP